MPNFSGKSIVIAVAVVPVASERHSNYFARLEIVPVDIAHIVRVVRSKASECSEEQVATIRGEMSFAVGTRQPKVVVVLFAEAIFATLERGRAARIGHRARFRWP